MMACNKTFCKLLLKILAVLLVHIGLSSYQLMANADEIDESGDLVRREKVLKALPDLDDLLAKASENAPEIVAAKARIVLAESEFRAKQLEVSRKVIALRDELKIYLWKLEKNKEELEWNKTHPLTGAGGGGGVVKNGQPVDAVVNKQYTEALEQRVAESRRKVEQAKKDLQVLVGNNSSANSNAVTIVTAKQPPQGPDADKIKTALTGSMAMDFAETPLKDVLDFCADKYHVQFLVQTDVYQAGIDPYKMTITLHMKDVPLWCALQALEDQVPEIQFVVRDYGILLANKDSANRNGYLSAVQFGKEAQAAAKENAAK